MYNYQDNWEEKNKVIYKIFNIYKRKQKKTPKNHKADGTHRYQIVMCYIKSQSSNNCYG